MTLNKIPIPCKTDLVILYTYEGKSLEKIGVEYGCSDSTVLKWLVHYGINRRPQRQYGWRNTPTREQVTIEKVTTKKKPIEKRPPKAKRGSTCNILKDHAKDLKDDPERLSTEFLQKIIGVKC